MSWLTGSVGVCLGYHRLLTHGSFVTSKPMRWFLAAIGHALQQHKTITGEDIDAIYRGAQGPTLDGSVYRTDGFLEQYGAYLAAAQAAIEEKRAAKKK